MKSIAIIGAGNLGRRHLQSILMLKEIEVFVIDQGEDSLAKAKEVENENGHNIIYATNFDVLPNHLNVVVIATSVLPRRQIVDSLLNQCTIDHLILEKLVFPRLRDYQEVGDKLSSLEMKTWVNCPFRMYEIFKNIKAELDSQSPISISVTGSNWGLGTTAIHVLDLLAYLRDDYEMNLVNILDPKILESKRKGYYEITGGIVAMNKYGDRLLLNDLHGEKKSPKFFTIDSINKRWHFQDNLNQGIFSDAESGWKEKPFEFRFPYQSELSSSFVNDLLTSGECELPNFINSIHLHHNYLKFLIDHFQSVNNEEIEICLVT